MTLKQTLRLLLLLPLISVVMGADKVVLQLKWGHELQFAGYYAAKSQGYYDALGIDVEIRSINRQDNSKILPVEEVKNGNADFAIGSLDILIAKDEGVELVVLAPIFQRSTNAVFSLDTTTIDNIEQLSKLRIAAYDNVNGKLEIEAFFRASSIDLNKIEFVDELSNIDTLINGKADAIVANDISTLLQSEEKQIALNKLHPAEFGVHSYGDTLYTSKKFVKSNPVIVEKFLRATKKGWLYALNNKQEILNKIKMEYFKEQDNIDHNFVFSSFINSVTHYPQIALGDNDKNRWFMMNERIRSLGVVKTHLDLNDFFFFPEKQKRYNSLSILALIVTLIAATFYFWYRRKLILTILCVLITIIIIDYKIESNLKANLQQSNKINLLGQLNAIAAKLKGDLQTNLSVTTGFAAYVSANPEASSIQLDSYAKEIFRKTYLINNFAVAKDLIVNYVFPLEGNQKVLGLDYNKNLEQKNMALQVASTGQMLVAGPVNLVQGGVAFIGRAPIYTTSGTKRKFWGIVSTVVNAQLLYQRSGILEASDELDIAIKSYDTLGNKGAAFYGEESVFSNLDKAEVAISVGGGTWVIAAVLRNSTEPSESSVLFVRLLSIVTGIFFYLLISFRFKDEIEKKILQDMILSKKNLLENVGSVAKIGGCEIYQDLCLSQWSRECSLLFNIPENFSPLQLSDLEDKFTDENFSLLKTSILAAFVDSKGFDIEVELKYPENRWIKVIASPPMTTLDKKTITATIQDITSNVESTKIIEHQANYDTLTNLPNRAFFNDRLCNAIVNSKRNNSKIAVLFIDLDRFKPVNDNHGHQVGDQLLIQASQRISRCLRDSDTVSRLSGDEFGVILTDISHGDYAIRISEDIRRSMRKAYLFSDNTIHCSASIGITIYPDDASNADSLIRRADQAMYEVKNTGRDGVHFYTQEMQRKSEYRHELLNKLITAINNDDLTVHYQPIIDVKNATVAKCESLARWQDKEGNFISPFEFIALAEESGLINRIDLFMLNNSANDIIESNKNFILKTPIELSINVSPRLFHTKDKALENWMRCIKKYAKKLKITVEITERLLTQDSEKALTVLNELKNVGIKIAIDDFGTGYSSLNYLVKFPVDIIKIDRSFVKEIGIKEVSETLIETILVLAKRLNLEVVAEGVETKQQYDFLSENGCDFIQGYYCAKPMSKYDLDNFIKAGL